MLSKLTKLFVGIILALSLLAVGGLTLARYLVEEFTAPPPKPIFAEENPSPSPQPTAQASVAPTTSTAIVPSPPTPSVSPKPTATPKAPDGKAARVTWPEGLMVRSAPDGESVGGVDFNTEVVVLETTADGVWQKIWANGQEGWVKAGNVELLPEAE